MRTHRQSTEPSTCTLWLPLILGVTVTYHPNPLEIGKVVGADIYSPCTLEPTHPDLFWYGIHGVETLFTIMGPGCRTVTRVHAEHAELAVGLLEQGLSAAGG